MSSYSNCSFHSRNNTNTELVLVFTTSLILCQLFYKYYFSFCEAETIITQILQEKNWYQKRMCYVTSYNKAIEAV